MLTLTPPIPTRAQGWPAGLKLAALAGTTVLLFRLTDPAPLLGAAAVVAALTLAPGPVFARAALRGLRPLWPFLVVIALWHLITQDLTQGAVILLRLLTAVAAANLVTLTTPLSSMLATFQWLLSPLARLGLPARPLALAVTLAIRFLPVTLDRIAALRLAFRARSPRGAGWRILMPAVLSALDDADHVAQALRARGGAEPPVKERPWNAA